MTKKVEELKSKSEKSLKLFVLSLASLFLVFVFSGCGGGGGGTTPPPQKLFSISGVVTLQGMDDHSGAKVEVRKQDNTVIKYTIITAQNGSYSISDIPEGTYIVVASKELYESKEQQVVLDNNKTINFTLTFKDPPSPPTKE